MTEQIYIKTYEQLSRVLRDKGFISAHKLQGIKFPIIGIFEGKDIVFDDTEEVFNFYQSRIAKQATANINMFLKNQDEGVAFALVEYMKKIGVKIKGKKNELTRKI